ncbi:MAG: DUF4097 family beta strand repeat-containing protein, partial [Edaphobacter sp.]
RIAGDVSITNSNGSVDLTSTPPLGNVTIQNRNGSVNVTVPEKSGFSYQLDATNGDIDSDFSEINIPDGGLQKKTVSGTVGKGGAILRLTTTQGDLSLKKSDVQPLLPTPPEPPKITLIPPDAQQSIQNAKQQVKLATRQAEEASREASKEAKEAVRKAKQAQQEATQQDEKQN